MSYQVEWMSVNGTTLVDIYSVEEDTRQYVCNVHKIKSTPQVQVFINPTPRPANATVTVNSLDDLEEWFFHQGLSEGLAEQPARFQASQIVLNIRDHLAPGKGGHRVGTYM